MKLNNEIEQFNWRKYIKFDSIYKYYLLIVNALKEKNSGNYKVTPLKFNYCN